MFFLSAVSLDFQLDGVSSFAIFNKQIQTAAAYGTFADDASSSIDHTLKEAHQNKMWKSLCIFGDKLCLYFAVFPPEELEAFEKSYTETFGEAKSSAEFMVERDTPEGESCKWRLFSRNLQKLTNLGRNA